MRPNFRERFRQSGRVLASFVLSHDASLVHVAQSSGVQVLILDFEHGMISNETACQYINAARQSEVAIFARIPKGDLHRLNALLDHGLDGVIVTESESVEDVSDIIRRVKFSPLGKRGINPFVSAANFGGMPSSEFAAWSNERTGIWIMAENRAIFERMREVCALPGLDGVFFGPYDLSVDCGLAGQVKHPTIVELLDRGVSAVRASGLSTGIFVRSADEAEEWIDKGVRLLAVGVDMATLADSWRATARVIGAMNQASR